ncbi:MAG: hypothetical protein KKH32_03795 [Bacteroidetes bacterium]|nr:hypothetical protein [Bacteroidota bacterium]
MIHLPQDFKEFLKLLNLKKVKYLVVGGYAVGYYGYPRATGDIDIWISPELENAERLVEVFREFGFNVPELSTELFLKENQIIRIGVPPLRLEILTTVSGLNFNDCYPTRTIAALDEVEVSFISLEQLKVNKRAANRFKDLDDLEKLP